MAGFRWLEAQDLPHRVEAPPSSWASLSLVQSGAVVTLAPARHGYSYEGAVRYEGQSVTLGEEKGPTRISFPENGEPEMFEVRSSRACPEASEGFGVQPEQW